MATKKEGVALLSEVPMFSEFSQRDLGRLWDHMKVVRHDDGHAIATEGKGGHGLHLILDGTVRVERTGKRVVLGPGDFFGEMALIDDGPRSATVTAEGPVVTAALSTWEFKSVVKNQPALLWKLLVHTTQRLREEQTITASLTS